MPLTFMERRVNYVLRVISHILFLQCVLISSRRFLFSQESWNIMPNTVWILFVIKNSSRYKFFKFRQSKSHRSKVTNSSINRQLSVLTEAVIILTNNMGGHRFPEIAVVIDSSLVKGSSTIGWWRGWGGWRRWWWWGWREKVADAGNHHFFFSFLAYPGRSAISDGERESSLTRLEQPSCSHSSRERFTNDNLKTWWEEKLSSSCETSESGVVFLLSREREWTLVRFFGRKNNTWMNWILSFEGVKGRHLSSKCQDDDDEDDERE